MKRTIKYITENEEKFKVCKSCGETNESKNDHCHNCGDNAFRDFDDEDSYDLKDSFTDGQKIYTG